MIYNNNILIMNKIYNNINNNKLITVINVYAVQEISNL